MPPETSRLACCRQSAVDLAAYLAVRCLMAVVQTLPLDMGDHLCRSLAWLLSGPLQLRRRVIATNLQQVFPDLDAQSKKQLTYAMWHHLMLMVCEVAWAQRRLHRSNWRKHVTFRGNQGMLQAMLSRRPAVMVCGHYGNFEMGSYAMGLMGLDTLAIARKLDNAYLHNWVADFRGAKGQQLVDKNGCAPVVEKHLSEGGTLSLLADQHAGAKGLWEEFCGVPASCHKALALFSLSTNAPMLAVYTRRVNGMPMQFENVLLSQTDPTTPDNPHCESVGSLTHWYNRQMERMIDIAPEQYWWLHRRWRVPPEKVAVRLAKRKQKAALAKAA